MNRTISVVASNDNKGCSIVETINAIALAGFKNVFVQWYDEEFDLSQNKQVELCKQKGLYIDFAHLGYQHINDIWTDDGDCFIERYKEDILDCHNEGIDMVVMHPCSKTEAPGPNELGLNRFKQIVEYAKTLGVKVAIENTRIEAHLRYLLDNITLDNFGLCFDVGHYHCNFKDNLDIASYKNRVFCVHLHDNDGNSDQHLLPFDGNLNWNLIIDKLDEVNYDGPITMELCYRNDYLNMNINDFYIEGYKRAEKIIEMIEEKKLENVAGGYEKREKTVNVEIPLIESGDDKTLDLYLDGEYSSAFSKTIMGALTKYVVPIKGTHDSKILTVKLNGIPYRTYVVDFENITYYEQ